MTKRTRPFQLALILGLLLQAGWANATQWTVGPNEGHRSLGEVIGKAEAYDTIRVIGGTYTEGTLAIERPLTLIGENQPVIDGNKEGHVLLITSSNVKVKGFSITGTAISSLKDYAGIEVVSSDDVVLEDNHFKDCFFAIHITRARRPVVRGNTVIGDPTGRSSERANAIHVWHCDSALIEWNNVRGHRDGLYLEFNTGAVVRNNECIDNSRYGLHFMFSKHNEYSHNVFRNNGAGVAVMYSKFIDMYDNQFLENRGASAYGLLLKDINDSEIANNTFVDNTSAMFVDGCVRSNIKDNYFRSNGWAIRLFANAEDCVFEGNSFVGNAFDLSANGKPISNTFRNNYWDRYTGYDLDRDGIGDVPFRPLSLFAMVNERMPYAVVLSRSLLTRLMDQAERLIPSITPEALQDQEPLMKMPDQHVARKI